jgi:hypothetical protein
MKRKVFGIGFHKTATTSLANALKCLGYRVTGPDWVDDPNIASNVEKRAIEWARKFDAFQDNPWPILYRELDQAFPGSKFVLTLRPEQQWISSVVNHFSDDETPMREWIYGVGHPKGNENIYLARYERHNREVTEYFKDRPGDLLVLNITEGEGWEKLCPFLDEPIPAIAFPCSNSAPEREKITKREQSYLWQTYFKVRRGVRRLTAGSAP